MVAGAGLGAGWVDRGRHASGYGGDGGNAEGAALVAQMSGRPKLGRESATVVLLDLFALNQKLNAQELPLLGLF